MACKAKAQSCARWCSCAYVVTSTGPSTVLLTISCGAHIEARSSDRQARTHYCVLTYPLHTSGMCAPALLTALAQARTASYAAVIAAASRRTRRVTLTLGFLRTLSCLTQPTT